MNIIICDDDAAQVEQLRRFLSARNAAVSAFRSGGEVLRGLPDVCDIAILEMKLPDMRGTQLALQLRRHYPDIDVILISSCPQYVTSAFRIHASQFLLKPIDREIFLAELDYILAQRRSRHYRWVVSNKTSIHALSPAEITFVEAYHRHLFIHTTAQTIDVCGKLNDACRELEGYGFLPCHQGFLVNMKYIHHIEGDSVLLSTGEHIPISSRKRRAFIERYTKFITH